jgi:hypothetical protein
MASFINRHIGSQHGWVRFPFPPPSAFIPCQKQSLFNIVFKCDVGPAHCNPSTCLKPFSGKNSLCAPRNKTHHNTTTTPSTKSAATTTATSLSTAIPDIDVCGAVKGSVTCPGAGQNKYFYRCCSSAGHCGPKNDIQEQDIYCGIGCQSEYGKCDVMLAPPWPTKVSGSALEGETCGPIVNRKCAEGLCCSGSNFCGKTVSDLFNWGCVEC